MTLAVSSPTARWPVRLGAGLIVLATLAAYRGSFSGPLVFDDFASIANNASIRQLWPLGPVLSPPADAGVGGRPIANLSFALNHALGGLDVRGYHALNLLIHAAAALALFGFVRHTLLLPSLRERFGAAATALATAIALLWAVHPLQTASVTYLSQRTELLMGLFYLLTLYGFARGAEPGARSAWLLLSVAACVLGMASKEVMVTAPLVVLLCDRTLVAGSFAAAWRARRKYYAVLAATWLLLAFLMAGVSQRGVGFGFQLHWWNYAGASCHALVTYLRLALWPDPLVFDYGPNVMDGVAIAPCAAVVVLLLALTALALWRAPRIGFLAAWFFVIAAPASSVVPIVRQLVAENRVYLPLAAVVGGVVLAAYAWLGRRGGLALVAVAVACGFLTVRRNADFRTDLALWADTVAKRPANWRAQNSLAAALDQAGRLDEAISHYATSLRLRPGLAETEYNFGNVLLKAGKIADAIAHYEEAFRIEPWRTDVPTNLGNALVQAGRLDEAVKCFDAALRTDPAFAAAHHGLGNALTQLRKFDLAIARYREALRHAPNMAAAHNGLGNALVQSSHPADAIASFTTALRLQPDLVEAHYNLGDALTLAGRDAEAISHYEAFLRARPRDAAAHNNLASALAQTGRVAEARAHLEEALRLKPDYDDARRNLARLTSDQKTKN